MLDEIRHRAETLGEFLHIRERLVVAPAWGRLRAGELDPGDLVEDGDVIGAIHEAGEDIPLVCVTRGPTSLGGRPCLGNALRRARSWPSCACSTDRL